MSIVNKDDFNPSVLISITLIYFSCIIALLRTSNNMFNSRGESRNSCLAPDISRKAFSLSPFSIILALGFSRYLVLYNVLSMPILLRDFNMKQC